MVFPGKSIQKSFPLPSMFTGSKHVDGCFPPSARGLKHSTRAAPVLETWDLPDLPNLKVAWDTHSPCSERLASCFSVFHVDSIGYFWVAKHGQKIGDFFRELRSQVLLPTPQLGIWIGSSQWHETWYVLLENHPIIHTYRKHIYIYIYILL